MGRTRVGDDGRPPNARPPPGAQDQQSERSTRARRVRARASGPSGRNGIKRLQIARRPVGPVTDNAIGPGTGDLSGRSESARPAGDFREGAALSSFRRSPGPIRGSVGSPRGATVPQVSVTRTPLDPRTPQDPPAESSVSGPPAAPEPAPARRRRQIGADRRTLPNPVVPPPASARSLAMGRLALTVTALSWLAYMVTVTGRQLIFPGAFSVRALVETIVYSLIVTLLTFSAVAYLITRQGYLRRTRSHARTPRAEIEAFFGERDAGGHRTRPVLPGAGRRHPPDDAVGRPAGPPPPPGRAARRRPADLRRPRPPAPALAAARAVPAQILGLLGAAPPPLRRFARSGRGPDPGGPRTRPRGPTTLVADYEHAAAWLEDLAGRWVRHDHTDDFFVDHVLLHPGRRPLGGRPRR